MTNHRHIPWNASLLSAIRQAGLGLLFLVVTLIPPTTNGHGMSNVECRMSDVVSGRFSSLRAFAPSRETNLFSYSYLPNTDLLSGYTAGDFTRTVSYEPYRSLITSVENKHASTTISQYDYTNDQLGRRTAIARSGTAFGDTPVRDAYGYNHRSEVTSARRTLADTPSQEVRGFSYDYAYDPIGNRISSTEYDHNNTPLVSSYTANALNQYEQRTIPGYAAVRGSATNTAVVTVNNNPIWRLDDYFYGGDEADNVTAAIMKELEIIAAHSNNYSAVTGSVFVAKTPEAFTYDDDGNLLSDGRFTYTWDAENRLIGVTTRDDLPASVPRVRVTHCYDHQSRRIATTTAAWTNSIWQSTESRTFTYDGWNEIAETITTPQSITTNLYVWGLDLSGTLQGAGGIGGLLAASFGNINALYCYDANGNVSQLINPDSSDILAHYEYNPFGGTIVTSGTLAKTNPFRFSTKHWDDATGLGYWGYRWYCAETGRWLNRDPIGDEVVLRSELRKAKPLDRPSLLWQARRSVYFFVLNNPVNDADPNGLLSLNEAAQAVVAHYPDGINDELTPGLMLCLLWKESSFNERATNPGSTAKGIAQILDGTADDIQDRAGPRRLGISSDPFYILPPGERLRDHRFDARVSVYAAYIYLEDRTRANGNDWERGVRAYGPNGDKVIECKNCCGVLLFDENRNLRNMEEIRKCLKKIHP